MMLLTLAATLAFANPLDATDAADTDAPAVQDVAIDALDAAPEAIAPETPVWVAPVPRYEADDTLIIRGESNDIFGAGDEVRLEQRVGDNAFLAGSRVTIDAPVDGDLFAAGQSVRIDAAVQGDVYAAGENVTLGPKGSIGGHLLAAGANVRIEGPIAGTVNVGSGSLVVAAPIGGDVQAEVGELRFEGAGTIGGALTYTSPQAVPGVQDHVTGAVDWSETAPETYERPSLVSTILTSLVWNTWRFASMLIVGAVLALLGGAATLRAASTLIDKPSQSLGFGLVGFVVLPLASLVMIGLILPLPLGLLGLTVFGTLLYVAQLLAALALGVMLLRRFRPESADNALFAMAVGLLPLVFFTALPWVGMLVWFAATVIGIGAMWLWTRDQMTAA